MREPICSQEALRDLASMLWSLVKLQSLVLSFVPHCFWVSLRSLLLPVLVLGQFGFEVLVCTVVKCQFGHPETETKPLKRLKD